MIGSFDMDNVRKIRKLYWRLQQTVELAWRRVKELLRCVLYFSGEGLRQHIIYLENTNLKHFNVIF